MLFEDRISLILKLIEQNGSIENSKIIKDLKMGIFYFFADLSVDNVEFFGFSLLIL